MKKKLAIIGASYLQNPLILKAQEMGLETHVFAWECGDIGEKTADFFYPLSIVEKDLILEKCRQIGVDGICTIASDLANVTVVYAAQAMGLTSNSLDCLVASTDKKVMRDRFATHGDPSPRSFVVDDSFDLASSGLRFPIIVKPADRSGSRGITRLEDPSEFDAAVARAREVSLSKTVLAEEFFEGAEYSVEYISWQGKHHFLAVTEKFTTGAPMFIETGHLEPARLSDEMREQVCAVVEHALDSLGVQYGASHSELKINDNGEIALIEIGSRMGGDRIGSDLVSLSSGYDFLKAVIQVALGQMPEMPEQTLCRCAGIRFIFSSNDLALLESLKTDSPGILLDYEVDAEHGREIVDSGSRWGYFLMAGDTLSNLEPFLPSHAAERR